MDKDSELNWKNLHPWFKQAYDIGMASGGFVEIDPSTQEFKTWLNWFEHQLEFIPQFIHQAKISGHPVTLPSRFPPQPLTLASR